MRVEILRRTLAVRPVEREIARRHGWMNHRLPTPFHSDSAARLLWMRVLAVVTYFAPAMFLGDETAHATPTIDPRAPIPFQPAVTQTSAGTPAVNIATPNSNVVSLNQYRSFGLDSQGLVLNGSTVAGTPLFGGTLGTNPNLNGRSASVIINQVTSTGPAAQLCGPLEVFGVPAAVVVGSPNLVSVNGLSLTNVTNLTLTTDVPQFLTGVVGKASDFTHAGAVPYNFTSGNITINRPSGNNGTPGAGVEGTVGNPDLIGQSVTVNAPPESRSTGERDDRQPVRDTDIVGRDRCHLRHRRERNAPHGRGSWQERCCRCKPIRLRHIGHRLYRVDGGRDGREHAGSPVGDGGRCSRQCERRRVDRANVR